MLGAKRRARNSARSWGDKREEKSPRRFFLRHFYAKTILEIRKCLNKNK